MILEYAKPPKCCYPNCFECNYSDCRYNGIERTEIIAQDKFDRELMVVDPEVRLRRKRQAKYANSEKGKDRTKRYEQSAKGTLRRKRYNRSEKGIAAANRYLASEKGEEMLERKSKKRIESGKNAEYCRRYYEKMKAKKALENI